jgi:hypothetical protein
MLPAMAVAKPSMCLKRILESDNEEIAVQEHKYLWQS